MIRPAKLHELEQLSELALRSKAVWGYSQAFMLACRKELTLEPEELANLVVQEIEARVVGFYALQRMSSSDMELAYLFVEPTELRKGYGMALMRDAIDRARRLGHQTLIIQGDPHATGFYLAAGARRVGVRESDSVPGRMLPLFELPLTGPA